MAVDPASVAPAPPFGRTTGIVGGLRGSRVLLLALLVGYFLVLLLLAREDGLVEAWRRLGVFALDPSFADMRSITSAWECVRLGADVLPVNPCDPWQRPANYPSLWLLPAATGLGQETTVCLGIVTALAFFTSFFFLVGRPPVKDCLVYAIPPPGRRGRPRSCSPGLGSRSCSHDGGGGAASL